MMKVGSGEQGRSLATGFSSEDSTIQMPVSVPKEGRALRVGVVGCGYWGSKHVRVLSALRSVSEVAVIDPNPRSREAMLAAFPASRAFADLDSALAHVDALVVPCRRAAMRKWR
jgi:phosphoglycerate dehydrogenase-like enzyme